MLEQDRFVPVILIVEDHPPTLELVQRLVSTALPACRVLTAETAEHALEQCASDVPHVVVMDIALPGMDGIEATRRIKALLPGTQVVMHSGKDIQIYRDAAVVAGASAFVAKSRSFSDLVPAIAALLPPSHRTGGLRSNPADLD